MTGLRQRIATFLDAQAAEAGAARNTILSYGRDLADFADWLATEALDFDRVTRDQIVGYLSHCEAQGLARSTRARRLSAIRQLTRFALEEGWREDDPAIRIQGPGKTQRLPKVLSQPEVTALLDAAPKTGRTEADRARNRCLIELLYATGMRVSEVLNLNLGDVDLESGVITIRNTKFGKSRLVPVHETTRAVLETYRDARAAHLAGREVLPFFISEPGRRITHAALGRAFKRLTRRIGLCDAGAPDGPRLHDLRHTMAVDVLQKCYSTGADPERRLPALSTYLGHSHLNYTYWYLHQNPGLMTEAMTRLQHRWEASP